MICKVPCMEWKKLLWTLEVLVTASRMHQTLEVLHLRYRIAGNFGGRKLSQISWFCGYSWKFSPWNLRAWCPLAWLKWAICESFLCENRNFHQFAPSKASCYTVLYPEYTKMLEVLHLSYSPCEKLWHWVVVPWHSHSLIWQMWLKVVPWSAHTCYQYSSCILPLLFICRTPMNCWASVWISWRTTPTQSVLFPRRTVTPRCDGHWEI